LIGASSIFKTEHETKFTVEGVWRKVRRVFSELLQAATNLIVEDTRAQWTTHDTLNQWFDDAKQDLLIKTGMLLIRKFWTRKEQCCQRLCFAKTQNSKS
jgi:hypothetical protein